jgi:membrane protein DedA with SNARE-associated domain
MVEKLLGILSGFVVAAISAMGYFGIILMMAVESACIPLPSEIIMPFSGFLVFKGQFSLFGIALAGALGCSLGSIVTYYIGLFGGRPLLEKFGKYVLITQHDMEAADKFFAKYGDKAIFISRLLPVVRTFISLPAGIAKMNVLKFNIYTFVGSFFWCFVLGWIGMKLGEHWNTLGKYFHRFDIVIGAIILTGAVYYLYRHLRKK